MKVIGLIGGMSWKSSAEYYSITNQEVNRRLGNHHSAKLLIYSLNFHDIEFLQHSGQWDIAGLEMIAAAKRLEQGGADCLVLCTNTMHKFASAIESEVKLPLSSYS